MSPDFPGQIRPSQLVTTFGPGSIMDLPEDSVMPLGLDIWPREAKVVHEPRMQSWLHVDEFRTPVSDDDSLGNVPCVSFPAHRVCSACNRLETGRWDASTGFFACPDCRSKTYPARFVMACHNGHIDEFPWVVWVHQGKPCAKPRLFLISTGRSGSLSDLLVQCRKKDGGCGAQKSMGKALSPDGVTAVVSKCTGSRPWIQNKDENCDAIPVGLQRGASNIYFSRNESSLSIPPFSGPFEKKLDRFWPAIQEYEKNNPGQLDKFLPSLFPHEQLGDLLEAVKRRQGLAQVQDLRTDEWAALRQDTPQNDEDFQRVPEPVPGSISPWIETLTRLERLREVRVLTGFTRIDPPDPEDHRGSRYSPLSRQTTDWLPGVEVFGEGIFLALRKENLLKWEGRPEVRERIGGLLNNFAAWRRQQGIPLRELPPPRTVLLHTLSHALIRELSLEGGYSSASIRERLYSSSTTYGILLYTASEDSAGSLGGLVEQGRGARFESLLKNAIASSLFCSSDPLCADQNPKDTGSLNGAACHICCFVSETSCEKSNRLLDRRTIIPLDTEPLSYFRDWA
jgi:MrfA Zn-binding domain